MSGIHPRNGRRPGRAQVPAGDEGSPGEDFAEVQQDLEWGRGGGFGGGVEGGVRSGVQGAGRDGRKGAWFV